MAHGWEMFELPWRFLAGNIMCKTPWSFQQAMFTQGRRGFLEVSGPVLRWIRKYDELPVIRIWWSVGGWYVSRYGDFPGQILGKLMKTSCLQQSSTLGDYLRMEWLETYLKLFIYIILFPFFSHEPSSKFVIQAYFFTACPSRWFILVKNVVL